MLVAVSNHQLCHASQAVRCELSGKEKREKTHTLWYLHLQVVPRKEFNSEICSTPHEPLGCNLTSAHLLTSTSREVGMTFKLQWVQCGIMTMVSSGNVVSELLWPSCQLGDRVKGGRVDGSRSREVRN